MKSTAMMIYALVAALLILILLVLGVFAIKTGFLDSAYSFIGSLLNPGGVVP